MRYQLLFERFLAPERDGPPDIDIDIESDRREEVIQYVYENYGRTTPRKWPTSTRSGRGWRSGTWPRRSVIRRASRTRTPSSWTAGRRWRSRASCDVPADVLALAWPDPGLPAASRHPFRRNGDLRPAGRAGLPGGMGADGEPLSAAVGQGRLRRHGSGQVRPARPRHAVRPALRGRPGPRARGRRGRLRPAGSGGAGGLRDAAAGRLGGGVPGRVPGADGDAAAAEAAHLLRPGGGGRADPSRPDPGRVGAPVHPPPQRAGAGHLRPPGDGAVAGQDPGHPAVPGAADAARRRRRRVRRRRGRPVAPGDGRQAVQPEDGEAEDPALRRDAGPARHHR